MKKIFFLILFILKTTNSFSFEKQAEEFIATTSKNAKQIILNSKISDLEKKKISKN